jgi:hypothetical protein
MGLVEEDGVWTFYPQLHRLHTNRLNCLLTAFTIKMESAGRTYSFIS